MPISFHWDDDSQQVMVLNVEGTWTLDEYYTKHTQVIAAIEQVTHRVVLVIDMTRNTAVPTGFMSTGRYNATHHAANVDAIIMVGISRFIELLIQMMQRVFTGMNNHFHIAHTLDEARAIAEQINAQSPTA